MKNRIDVKSAVIGAVLGVGLILSFAAVQPNSSRATTWEYKIVYGPNPTAGSAKGFETTLNEAGKDGWEAVGIVGGQERFSLMKRVVK